MADVQNTILNAEGLTVTPGMLKVYNFDLTTGLFTGSSTEYLPIGVGIPANATIIEPAASTPGKVCIFLQGGWQQVADHRGEVVYSTENGEAIRVSSLGNYPQGTTTLMPSTPYDKWDGKEWVTDTTAQQDNNIEAANLKKSALIDSAMQPIRVIQLKLQAGRALTDLEKNQLNAVLDYIDAVSAIDTASAPDISWPHFPA